VRGHKQLLESSLRGFYNYNYEILKESAYSTKSIQELNNTLAWMHQDQDPFSEARVIRIVSDFCHFIMHKVVHRDGCDNGELSTGVSLETLYMIESKHQGL
jgi:hypothetical protein